jgi:hypothetical protein
VKIIVASELRSNIVAVSLACWELKIDVQLVNIIPLRRVLQEGQAWQVQLAQQIEYAKERVTHARQADLTGDVYITITGYMHGDGPMDWRSVVACATRDGRKAVSYAPGPHYSKQVVVADALSKLLVKPDVTVSERHGNERQPESPAIS